MMINPYHRPPDQVAAEDGAALPIVRDLRDQGVSFHRITTVINSMGIPYRGRGGTWCWRKVYRVAERNGISTKRVKKYKLPYSLAAE